MSARGSVAGQQCLATAADAVIKGQPGVCFWVWLAQVAVDRPLDVFLLETPVVSSLIILNVITIAHISWRVVRACTENARVSHFLTEREF